MNRFRLPSEIPLEEWPPPSAFIEESKECVKAAENRGLKLRVMGGLAIFMHSHEHQALWEKLERIGPKVFTDIDYVAYGKDRIKLMDLFRERGFDVNQKMLYMYGKDRHIYYGERIPMAEIFFDKLSMNHIINYRGRLEVDSLTVPLSELLLQKLQMVRMNEKDIKDAIIILRAHSIGEDDDDRINRLAVAAPLLSDWGFYYTATTNIRKIACSLQDYDVLSGKDKDIVRERAEDLLSYLENLPKGFKWKARASLGTKIKWYNEVDEWDVINTQEGEEKSE